MNRPPGAAGRCHLYVFPFTWEDYGKLGFSRDPLARLQALHHRWYDCFDLDRGALVATETERDARDLELRLRHALRVYNAPAPLTIRPQGAGHTEWYRGAEAALMAEVEALRREGYVVHAPLRPWLRQALVARGELLYDWTLAQLPLGAWRDFDPDDAAQVLVRDVLDGYRALDIPLAPLLAPEVLAWHGRCDRVAHGDRR
ncbi:GIY-YIG nuclease family protein [Luteimonas vadosa]